MSDKRKIAIMAVFIILVLLALTPWYAFASQTCEDLFRPVPFTYTLVERHGDITDTQISEIKDVIDQTAMMVRAHLALPKNVNLYVEPKGKQAAGGRDTVAVPYQYGPKSPRHTHAVIAHEFGHTISMANHQPAYDVLVKRFEKKLEELERKLYLARVQRSKLARQTFDFRNGQEPPAELRAAIQEAEANIKILEQEVKQISAEKFVEFRFGYEEFFADVVAVSVLQNPRALYSVTFPVAESKQEARNRDFLRPAHAKDWNNSHMHEVFTPARYALSQHPVAVRLFKENPGRLVRLVFDAISRDVLDLADNYELLSLTPEQRNLSLINNLNITLDNEALISSSTTSSTSH